MTVGGGAEWLTGPEFQRQLRQPVDVVWSGNPLREAIRNLSRTQQVAILIDRRLDPQQKLEMQLMGIPLEEALAEVARDRRFGLSVLDGVVYLGPPQAAWQLRTLAALRVDDVRRLPPAAAKKWLGTRPLAWNDFATPRELLQELAEQSGLRIEGLDRVPHDLWAAADLPPLSLIDRLTLVAVQFDLTFQIEAAGDSLSLVPLPSEVALVRSYPGGADPAATAAKFAESAPDARVKVVGDKIYVKGRLEDHLRIAAPQQAHERIERVRRPPSHGTPQVRIDKLSVREIPLDSLLDTLAKRLDLELRIDRAAVEQAEISLKQRVSVNVENVSIDDLFDDVLKSTGLTFRRRGNVVEVSPRDTASKEP